MDSTQDDAQVLWHDMLTLLAKKKVGPSTLAMLRSCKVAPFDGSTITISTSLGFARRKILQQAPIIEECLSEAAFQPVGLVVELSQAEGPQSVETIAQVTSEEAGLMSAPDTTAQHRRRRAVERARSAFADSAQDLAGSKLTFERFVAGEENMLAFEAAKQVADGENKGYNPLFIYGPSGVGKTHLCHAIGLRIRQMHPEKRVLYVSAHRFRIQYTDAVIKNTSNDFLNFYQSLDVLILDDIHELVGLNKTQMAFFHIFNNLHQLGKQLVLTADKAPVDMQGLEERLITRLKWGLTAELGRPDAELRRTILRNKIEAEGLVLSDEVFNFIVDHVTENIRDLEGVLVSLMANSLINNSPVDMAMAQRVVGQTVRVENKELSIEKIQEKVCRFFNLEESLVQTPSRKREIVQARQITMFLAKKYTSASFSRIGKVVGGKDHATVLHACKTVKDQMDINKNFRSTVEAIEETLRS